MIDRLIEKLAEQYPDSNHRLTVEDFATWLNKHAAPVVERQEPVAVVLPERLNWESWKCSPESIANAKGYNKALDDVRACLDKVKELNK